jgi:hypothetical protein
MTAQERPDLSGTWSLRQDSAMAGATDSASADTVPPGSPPSDLRPTIRGGGKEKDHRQLSRLLGMAQPVGEFRLTQTDTTVTVTNADGFSYTVRPGARSDPIVLPDSSRTDVRARWRSTALEIEYRPAGGGRIIERYELSDSRQFLRLEVTVEHDLLVQRLWRPRMYRRQPVE